MKKLLALILALLLLPTLAAAEPVMSPEMNALKTANEVLMTRYGLTLPALGLFEISVDLCGETAIVTYRGHVVPEALAGTYYVIIAPHGVQPLWTHDGSLLPWQDGDLNSPVWGMPQLQQYLNVSAGKRKAVFDPYYPEDLSTLEAFEAAGGSYHDVTSANRGAADSARALAIRAITAMYGLTEAEAAALYAPAGDVRLARHPDGHGEWEVLVLMEGGTEEVCFYVTIHAETGLIQNIEIRSGGVG